MMTYALLAEEAASAPGAATPGDATTTTTQAPGDGPVNGKAQPEGSMWSMLLPLVLMLVVFYFLLIRPQRKKEQERQKQREEMLKALRKNDHVMTIGGLHGIVASFTDEEVVLKVDEKNDVRLRFTRDAISKVIDREGGPSGVERPGEKLEEKH